jgi:hypothetical protein
MQIMDPLGLPGAPQDTLRALLTRLEGAEWAGAGRAGGALILITDRQGERLSARYAALLTGREEALLTAPAFGPAYGEAGTRALVELTHWAQARNLPVRETVLNASDFVRVLAEPDGTEVARLIAASNPSDPGIYTAVPRRRPARDAWEE